MLLLEYVIQPHNVPIVPYRRKGFVLVPSCYEASTLELNAMQWIILLSVFLILGKPICYFEFIMDPDSFGHTIENMFYVSFLVKVRC